jgi:hypothetical protein
MSSENVYDVCVFEHRWMEYMLIHMNMHLRCYKRCAKDGCFCALNIYGRF